MPRIEVSKVYTQIEPKSSVSRHWKSINKTSMSLPSNVSKNFTKAVFSLRDIVIMLQISKLSYLRNPLYLCKVFTTRLAT